ncbi:hypothetical protein EGY07_18675 [Chryseobacterium indologenes]|nr:hypothetical protein CEQ15_20305 [Chryseobacterium indologenes]AYZ37417.1 hypothetical protein EGY07_18675 [Chryseobacterium indologenes]HAO28776.1 hypothetical protein [Chryseobacterium indologenes]
MGGSHAFSNPPRTAFNSFLFKLLTFFIGIVYCKFLLFKIFGYLCLSIYFLFPRFKYIKYFTNH